MHNRVETKDVTISVSCISTIFHKESVHAVENTLKCIKASKIYWFSDIDFPRNVGCEVVNIRIPPFDRTKNFNDAYSNLTLKVMPEIVDTDYNLIVQHDGYAVNAKAWTDCFLNYDYIGSVMVWYPKKKRASNGGFCLRSRKLYNAMKSIDIKYKLEDLIRHKNFDKLYPVDLFGDRFIGMGVAEDFIITQVYRKQLEKEHKIKFAPEKIANRFSIADNFSSPWAMKSFGFHSPILLNYYNSVFPFIFHQSNCSYKRPKKK
jgi:hypothetical protein